MRLGPVSLSKNAAQVWPQLMARHAGDALDLDNQLRVDKGLAVRPVRDGLLWSSDGTPTLLRVSAMAWLSGTLGLNVDAAVAYD